MADGGTMQSDGNSVEHANCQNPRAEAPAMHSVSLGSDTMGSMEIDELAEHLDALRREACYRVDSVLKESPVETTQRVYFVGTNGSEQGPYIRKYIKRDAGLGSAYRRIFEAQRAGRRFRHIPLVVDCYDADDMLVVVMEYVRGETLADVVYRCDPSLPLAVDVFCRLCDAVAELHEAFDPPIIHRDLKPSNIILSHDSLTIIDFGIARAFRKDADADTVRFGTRAYAPPEQFGYRQTDVRSDVYALGMLLYFCLVEKTPDARVREQGLFDSRIPASVREVLLRATAFDPDDRYESVREFKAAFLFAIESMERSGKPSAVELNNSVDSIEWNVANRQCAARAFVDNASRDEPRPCGRQPVPAPDDCGKGNPGGASSPLKSVPLWAGVLWDGGLIALWVAFAVSGIDQVVLHPTGEAASYPMWYNVVMYVGVMVMFACFFFALLDKRLIARYVPSVRRVQGKRGAVLGIVAGLLSIVTVVAIGVVMLLVTQHP